MQPMGALFEQCLLLVLEGVVVRLMQMRGADSDDMFQRHANLE
jgi:6-phospho-3-hexuloisomerase